MKLAGIGAVSYGPGRPGMPVGGNVDCISCGRGIPLPGGGKIWVGGRSISLDFTPMPGVAVLSGFCLA